jgi:hypothetical protein
VRARVQELLPSKEAEDGETVQRAGGGQVKAWLTNLGKKNKAEDPEALKVRVHRVSLPS